jgi:hypothetical protein
MLLFSWLVLLSAATMPLLYHMGKPSLIYHDYPPSSALKHPKHLTSPSAPRSTQHWLQTMPLWPHSLPPPRSQPSRPPSPSRSRAAPVSKPRSSALSSALGRSPCVLNDISSLLPSPSSSPLPRSASTTSWAGDEGPKHSRIQI